MPRRVEDYRGLTHLSRLKLLHAVQRLPGRRLSELAEEAGLHVNTTREHLELMEREGLIQSFTLTTGSRGRPPKVFHPVDAAVSNDAAASRAAQARERGDLLRRISPELDRTAELGVEATHQIDTLYEHLEDAGFEPVLDETNLTIGLTPCRYLTAMESDTHVVCSVHVKLIRAHLEQLPGPTELRRVEPFVTPEHCVIALGLRGEETRAPRAHRGRQAAGSGPAEGES